MLRNILCIIKSSFFITRNLSLDIKPKIIRLLDTNGKIIGTQSLQSAEEYAKKIKCVLVKEPSKVTRKYDEYMLKKKNTLFEKINSKKNVNLAGTKKMQINHSIDKNDLETKLNLIKGLLKKNYMFNVTILGKNNDLKEKLLNIFKEKLSECGIINQINKSEINLKFKITPKKNDTLNDLEEKKIDEESIFDELEELVEEKLSEK